MTHKAQVMSLQQCLGHEICVNNVWSNLILGRMRLLANLMCNPQISTRVHLRFCTDTGQVAQGLSCPMAMSLAEGDGLPSRLSTQTVHRRSSRCLFRAVVCAFLCFSVLLVVISLITGVLNHGAKVLPSDPKCTKAVKCLQDIWGRGAPQSLIYSAVGPRFSVNEPTIYIK